jgi:hypothetical protein
VKHTLEIAVIDGVYLSINDTPAIEGCRRVWETHMVVPFASWRVGDCRVPSMPRSVDASWGLNVSSLPLRLDFCYGDQNTFVEHKMHTKSRTECSTFLW